MFKHRIATRLRGQVASGLYRQPPRIERRSGKHVTTDGRRLLSFSSNDYLGLGDDETLAGKVAQNFAKLGASSSSSRLVSGNYSTIERAERAYAEFFGYESALFFPSGYQANFGTISTVFEKGDTLLFDKHVHASTVSGMLASGARLKGYSHNDMAHLGRRLEGVVPDRRAVLTESLFSMDGDLLPVDALHRLKGQCGFFTIVDEAHSFGALGDGGRGIAHPVADIAVGTFGKALGLFGAFVLLPSDVREYLVNFASPLIYSTTLPEAHAASAIDVLGMIETGGERRARLSQVSQYAKERLTREGLSVSGDAHIVVVDIGQEDLAANVARSLLDNGILAFAARYPTVPLGRAILRISLTARHDKADVDLLAETLISVLAVCKKKATTAA